MKIQSMNDLETEMRKVVRGEIAAPPDAHLPTVESAAALIRSPTPENRKGLVSDETFDDFLAEQGMMGACEDHAVKEIMADQLAAAEEPRRERP